MEKVLHIVWAVIVMVCASIIPFELQAQDCEPYKTTAFGVSEEQTLCYGFEIGKGEIAFSGQNYSFESCVYSSDERDTIVFSLSFHQDKTSSLMDGFTLPNESIVYLKAGDHYLKFIALDVTIEKRETPIELVTRMTFTTALSQTDLDALQKNPLEKYRIAPKGRQNLDGLVDQESAHKFMSQLNCLDQQQSEVHTMDALTSISEISLTQSVARQDQEIAEIGSESGNFIVVEPEDTTSESGSIENQINLDDLEVSSGANNVVLNVRVKVIDPGTGEVIARSKQEKRINVDTKRPIQFETDTRVDQSSSNDEVLTSSVSDEPALLTNTPSGGGASRQESAIPKTHIGNVETGIKTDSTEPDITVEHDPMSAYKIPGFYNAYLGFSLSRLETEVGLVGLDIHYEYLFQSNWSLGCRISGNTQKVSKRLVNAQGDGFKNMNYRATNVHASGYVRYNAPLGLQKRVYVYGGAGAAILFPVTENSFQEKRETDLCLEQTTTIGFHYGVKFLAKSRKTVWFIEIDETECLPMYRSGLMFKI